MSKPTEKKILAAIQRERDRQDLKWGGALHDDQHDPNDWVVFVVTQLADAAQAKTAQQYQKAMICVAALAVAALEYTERRTGLITEADKERG